MHDCKVELIYLIHFISCINSYVTYNHSPVAVSKIFYTTKQYYHGTPAYHRVSVPSSYTCCDLCSPRVILSNSELYRKKRTSNQGHTQCLNILTHTLTEVHNCNIFLNHILFLLEARDCRKGNENKHVNNS